MTLPIRLALAAACLLLVTTAATAQRSSILPVPSPARDGGVAESNAGFPDGFVNEPIASFVNATGVTFSETGRVFVWEKAGVVYMAPTADDDLVPLLDISEEVGNWGDHGLVAFALDPDFESNGHIYLYYAVDYHHLMNFGTPAYDPAVDEDYVDTMARVTRYTANPVTGFTTIVPGTRQVLLGESVGTGVPLCSDSHGVGAMHFGTDGTLLLSAGDGHAGTASATCLEDGIITPKEDIFQYRAQLVDSLSGKLLRIDPTTGDGVPSNPFYDPSEPRAARSRVYALGLRQPFRFQVRPGTGSSDPAAGDPGTVYVSDVGQSKWEEIDVVDEAGLNFGWPIWEGLKVNLGNEVFLNPNMDAPNPLFGMFIPGFGPCEKEFFDIQDLIVESTLNTPMWVNPCDPTQPVVSSEPLHVHEPPVIEWSHQTDLARVPIYDASGDLDVIEIGVAGSPVAGESFAGACASENLWYTGSAYPPEYRDRVYFADFARGWIRTLEFDAADTLLSVELFADPVGRVVSMAYNPADEMIYDLTLSDTGISTLNRLRHVGDDAPPVVKLDAPGKTWGPSPLTLTFDGSASTDPEGFALSYDWDFGDGTPRSREPVTTHTFPSTDVSSEGSFIARIFELDPPTTMTTTSNTDPDVMRDGDIPPKGTANPSRQFDTFHHDGTLVPDKGDFDWIGYEFSAPQQFVKLVFQEGMTFGGLGGWWNEIVVQVRQSGQWIDVTEPNTSNPAYPGEFFPSFEQFEFVFEPTVGDAIRLYGKPGGSFKFVTIGELRVLALDDPAVVEPTNYTVTLDVSDELGSASTDDTTVFVDNSPPSVDIMSPQQFTPYSSSSPQLFTLRATIADAEAVPGQLACEWQVSLHHNDHVHPGAPDTDCVTQALLATDACNGELHFQSVRLTVTDPQGLSRTRFVYLPPDCDLNLNGIDDALDIANGTSLDANSDGVPDEVEVDCDGNGLSDFHEIFFGTTRDRNGNGVPDVCDPLGFELRGNLIDK